MFRGEIRKQRNTSERDKFFVNLKKETKKNRDIFIFIVVIKISYIQCQCKSTNSQRKETRNIPCGNINKSEEKKK